jgi:hypothetical protein
VKEIDLSYFERFIKKLIWIELFLFSAVFLFLFILNFDKTFLLSFIVGFLLSVIDYYLLMKYSKSVPYHVLKGIYPKTGFLWRFLIITGLLLISISLFTRINFFAIILAVVTATVGLFIATLKHSRERGEWKEAS